MSSLYERMFLQKQLVYAPGLRCIVHWCTPQRPLSIRLSRYTELPLMVVFTLRIRYVLVFPVIQINLH